jgi:hypothetical protein
MRVLIFFFALTLSFTTESQTVFKVSEVDSFQWGHTLTIEANELSFPAFLSVYESMNDILNYNEIDTNLPRIDDSIGEYHLDNPSILFNDVKSGTAVDLVYILQDTEDKYVAAYIFFDEEGYGVYVWASRQP